MYIFYSMYAILYYACGCVCSKQNYQLFYMLFDVCYCQPSFASPHKCHVLTWYKINDK